MAELVEGANEHSVGGYPGTILQVSPRYTGEANLLRLRGVGADDQRAYNNVIGNVDKPLWLPSWTLSSRKTEEKERHIEGNDSVLLCTPWIHPSRTSGHF